jgi:hypothetical protein
MNFGTAERGLAIARWTSAMLAINIIFTDFTDFL